MIDESIWHELMQYNYCFYLRAVSLCKGKELCEWSSKLSMKVVHWFCTGCLHMGECLTHPGGLWLLPTSAMLYLVEGCRSWCWRFISFSVARSLEVLSLLSFLSHCINKKFMPLAFLSPVPTVKIQGDAD